MSTTAPQAYWRLFGASLPQSFFEVLENDLPAAVVIVAGTSLVVSPANLIALAAPERAANHM